MEQLEKGCGGPIEVVLPSPPRSGSPRRWRASAEPAVREERGQFIEYHFVCDKCIETGVDEKR